jgi:Tfp pilus assembly protein PilN
MKYISLEYANHKSQRSKVGGITILFTSLALAAYMAHGYAGLADSLERLQAQQDRIKHRQAAVSSVNQSTVPAVPPALRSEVEESNRVMRQLGLPWDDLFSAIESTPREHVVVLSIQPDAEQASVTISAEAKEASDIANFVYALGESDVLKGAHLVSHQVKTQDPQKPVGFTVTATWATVAKKSGHADIAKMP